ncbi:MAG: hypothetical protein NT018_00905 [Armatimonadetes bacterium]|nr:hypothetical protein [Armatimonadota bacterium]
MMINSKGILLLTTAAIVMTTALPALRCHAQVAEPAPTLNAPAPIPAETPEPKKPRKPRLALKPSAGIYLPTNDKTRSRFGDSWMMIGITVDYRDEDRSKDRLQFQFDGISRKSDSDYAAIFPFGFKYTHRLGMSRAFSPYVGGTASLCIANIRSLADNIDTGFRFAGPGGSVFAGVNVGMNVKLEMAYHMFPSFKSFDLSGLSFGASLQF